MWHDIRTLNAVTNALLGTLALSVLAAAAWWVAQRPMFTLKVIRIEPAADAQLKYVNPSTIRATAVPRIRGNFFTADLDKVRQAFEAVPWVRKAAVRREWPNQLIIALEEHEPLGIWGENGRLLSVKGELFTANLAEAEEDGQLPEFAGPSGSEKEVLARYNQFRDWFKAVNLAPEAVQLSSRYAWTVRLNNGMSVELGREQSPSTLKERVDRLIGVYPELTARLQNTVESVDLRYPNGLALKAQGLVLGTEKKGPVRSR